MNDRIPIINCQDVVSSTTLANDRIERASQIFGNGVVRRLLCWALFLLGVDRTTIARLLHIPVDTTKSILKTIQRDGLPALEDRRGKASQFLPVTEVQSPKITVARMDDQVIIGLNRTQKMTIPTSESLQLRIVVLSFVNNQLITTRDAANALALSLSQVQNLARKLQANGVDDLIDKRQGQLVDYRMTPEVKAEMVQQFVLDIVSKGKTSGDLIAAELDERCQLQVSGRTIRNHIALLGLHSIKETLPKLLSEVKKNCSR